MASSSGGTGPMSPSLAPRKKQRSVAPPKVCHGNCIEKMKGLRDASVRLVLADPPYGIGVQGVKWDGDDGYMGFAKAWLAEAARILQPGGTLLYFSSPCTIWASRINILLQDTYNLTHQQTLTWVYAQGKPPHSNPDSPKHLHTPALHPPTTLCMRRRRRAA